MQRYVTYVSKHLGWSALVVVFSLTSIVWLTQALRFVDFIVNRGVSVGTFVELTLLLIPSLMFEILPMALFVAAIFVYNRFISDSELLVMQSSGLSRAQLCKPVILVGVLATLFALFISFIAMPVTYRQFKEMQTYLRDNYASLLLQEEVFNTPVEGLTVFVRTREDNGMLRGILVHDNRDKAHPVTMMAQMGQLQQTAQGPRFLLINGNRQELDNGRLSLLKFDRYTVDLSFYAKEVAARDRKPDEMYVWELFDEAATDSKRHNELLAEAHHRILWPLFNLTLPLFAAVMLLSGEFNRRGNWRRIGLAVPIAIVIAASGLSMQNIAARNEMLIPLLYLHAFGLLAVTFWLMRETDATAIPATGGA